MIFINDRNYINFSNKKPIKLLKCIEYINQSVVSRTFLIAEIWISKFCVAKDQKLYKPAFQPVLTLVDRIRSVASIWF